MASTHSAGFKRVVVHIALTSGSNRGQVVTVTGVGLSMLGKWTRTISDNAKMREQEADPVRGSERLPQENRILRDLGPDQETVRRTPTAARNTAPVATRNICTKLRSGDRPSRMARCVSKSFSRARARDRSGRASMFCGERSFDSRSGSRSPPRADRAVHTVTVGDLVQFILFQRLDGRFSQDWTLRIRPITLQSHQLYRQTRTSLPERKFSL